MIFKSKLQLETEYSIKMTDVKYNQLVSVISLRKLVQMLCLGKVVL